MLAETATDPLISGNWLIGVAVAIIGALSTAAVAIIGKLKVDEAKRQTVTLQEPLPEFPTRKVSTPPSWDAHRAVCDRVSRLEEAFGEMRREQAAQYRDMMQATNGIETRLIENILRGAVAGDQVRQWELFDIMLDTWPELAAVYGELAEGVLARFASWEPCAEEGEAPTPTAADKAKAVGTLLRRTAPEPLDDENDFEGTVRDLLDGWFRGVVMLEVQWHAVAAGGGTLLGPRCTSWAHPTHFAWGTDGRIGLRTAAGVTRPPAHRFLTGIHKARSGRPRPAT